MSKKDPRLARAGVSGYNKPKRTPGHKTKSHIVVAKEGDKIKTIRFGQQGVKTAGKSKAGESAKQKARRKSFKARHAKNIKKGKFKFIPEKTWANVSMAAKDLVSSLLIAAPSKFNDNLFIT